MKWQPQSQSGCVVVVDGRPRYLPQVKTDIHTTIFDITSRTHLTQQFVNPSSKDPIDEISYVFPLYDGVSVISFTCTVADRIIKGVVKSGSRPGETIHRRKRRGESLAS
uniref:VIT domain-containing protein n=1 Tax=Bionectria ochroleuca TaxID=29856 RepID=A0A8H7KDA7_BIOOC